LFNFQGALFVRFLSGSFVIISKLGELVKNFFQNLLGFLLVSFQLSRPSLERSRNIAPQTPNVNTFFIIFQGIFLA